MPNSLQASTVQVVVTGGPSVDVPWAANMNAQQALEAAYNAINDTDEFTFALQYYGSQLGYLVVMINETYDSFASSSKPFFYWEFLLNGVPSSSGIDGVILSPGDVVTFSFESYSSATHADSTLHAKYARQVA